MVEFIKEEESPATLGAQPDPLKYPSKMDHILDNHKSTKKKLKKVEEREREVPLNLNNKP